MTTGSILRRVCASCAVIWLLAGCAGAPEPAASTTTDGGEPAKERDIEVTYDGNETIPGFRLGRVIEDLLIVFSRNPVTDAPILDAASDLTDHYLDLGFPEAEVEYAVDRTSDVPTVRFVVREGPRVTMPLVALGGNTRLATDELLPLWRRTKSGLLGTGDPYFVESDLEAFRLSIGEAYRSVGYLDVDIGPLEIERAPGAETATVRITIHENDPYRLGGITFESPFEPAEQFESVAALLDEIVGATYDPLAVRKLRLRIQQSYATDGFPDARIRIVVDVDTDAKSVHGTVRGRIGGRVSVRDVHISGNDRTVESVVRDAVRIEDHELFNVTTVEETVRELYLTGLFERVEVARTPVAEGVTDLDIQLTELDAREVSFLAGYGSYERLRGGIFFTDANFLGLGHKLRIGTRASIRSIGADTTWREPTLFGTSTGLTATAFIREREEPAFTDVSRGFSTALDRQLLPDLLGRFGYGLEDKDGRDIDPALRGTTPPDFVLGALFTELTYDTRDSPIFPTEGHRESVKYEYARRSLGSDVEFDRLTLRTSFYVPFARDWTLGFAAEAGWIWNQDATDVPIQERFFNGGESSVRSFREAKLGPQSADGSPSGGEFFNTFTAEFRFPLVRALKGAVFTDAGNVGTRVEDYSFDDLRYAIGAGLRLALPIGPIRLDAGINPNPREGERDYALHFSVGYPF